MTQQFKFYRTTEVINAKITLAVQCDVPMHLTQTLLRHAMLNAGYAANVSDVLNDWNATFGCPILVAGNDEQANEDVHYSSGLSRACYIDPLPYAPIQQVLAGAELAPQSLEVQDKVMQVMQQRLNAFKTAVVAKLIRLYESEVATQQPVHYPPADEFWLRLNSLGKSPDRGYSALAEKALAAPINGCRHMVVEEDNALRTFVKKHQHVQVPTTFAWDAVALKTAITQARNSTATYAQRASADDLLGLSVLQGIMISTPMKDSEIEFIDPHQVFSHSQISISYKHMYDYLFASLEAYGCIPSLEGEGDADVDSPRKRFFDALAKVTDSVDPSLNRELPDELPVSVYTRFTTQVPPEDSYDLCFSLNALVPPAYDDYLGRNAAHRVEAVTAYVAFDYPNQKLPDGAVFANVYVYLVRNTVKKGRNRMNDFSPLIVNDPNGPSLTQVHSVEYTPFDLVSIGVAADAMLATIDARNSADAGVQLESGEYTFDPTAKRSAGMIAKINLHLGGPISRLAYMEPDTGVATRLAKKPRLYLS